MNQLTITSPEFSFSAGNLSQQLLEQIRPSSTGYWQHQFERLEALKQPFEWNLGIVNGRIVYAGNRLWSQQATIGVIQRYVPRTTTYSVKLQLESLKRKILDRSLTPAQLLSELKQLEIVDEQQLLDALRLKVLSDLDRYLELGGGQAKFMPDPSLALQLPLVGFEPSALLAEAKQRQQLWSQVKRQIPSTNSLPTLDRAAMTAANLPLKHQQRIEKMTQSGKNINEIADEMAKDTLDIAQMFAKLAKSGVVKFTAPNLQPGKTILAIDDSPVMLAQFEQWLTALGYPVSVCADAELALTTIDRLRPAAVFIDINMPIISGFELVKQIRQQPALAQIPLVILTGEQKLSNKWRAQWTGCEFLTKPLTTAAIADFQAQLKNLIPKLLEHPVSTTPQSSTSN